MYTSIQMRIYTCMYLVVRRGHGRELGAAVGPELLKVERHVLHAPPQDLDLVVLLRPLLGHHLAQLLERLVEHEDGEADGVRLGLVAHARVEEAERVARVEAEGNDVLAL